jgi:hypothetical protein
MPVVQEADDPSGFGSRLLGQQAAAQAPISAYSTCEGAQGTRIADLEAALAAAKVTATALVQVAANTVLDPTRQSLTVQTDVEGMMCGDDHGVAEARTAPASQLARYPPGCRAGFMLVSGNAPSV